MSFREIRLFTEMMRSLGYPRVISLENFRTPNFPLVAEILRWLVCRYDSYAELPSRLDSEQDRVLFIKTAIRLIFTKACIKLNSKRLYQADGFAVRELIKITRILYEATQNSDSESKDEQNCLNVTEIFDFRKVKQLQEARNLCSQLASSGASLNSLLNKEVDIKELRGTSLRRQIDREYVEESIKTAKNAINGQIDKIQSSLVNITADETNLDMKIEKKRSELERNRKRLSTLQSVRPVYMEEYEQLEEELSSLYTTYLTKFRNLTFLESQYEYLLDNINQNNEDTEITLKNIADKVKTYSFRDEENQRTASYGGDENTFKNQLNLKTNAGEYSSFCAEVDNDTSDNDDIDDDDDDSINDNQTENAEDIVENDNSFYQSSNGNTMKRRFSRNQLKPEWSPGRQRIPGTSYHGRTQSSNNSDDFQVNEGSYRSTNMDESLLTKRSQKDYYPTASAENEKQTYLKHTLQSEENEHDDF
ncbi:unnamed protein product [Schistosoma rodhaini]|uniref:Clusterin-associated protein 1 n=1 Tax=Schistosoma mansoni TaxID=6183 RepID=A0A3Q0KH45_SCHMA|nr:unnamed protein product [Schistosoma rodhaini]